MEFKAITTQEEFEARLAERLEQKERSVKKQFEGYVSPEQFEGYVSPQELENLKQEYENKIGALESSRSELNGKLQNYETKIAEYESDSVKTRIAMEMGIPLELKDRLKGQNEDELREDARLLASYSTPIAPLVTPADDGYNSEDEAYKKMVKNLD
ncbi:hypothetical protein [Coprobacillus cateniformis]|uniref:hypothetical protein n=1 Tax=Coprobacillus cateniformis TaxID=100884 RepID=UPI00399F688F